MLSENVKYEEAVVAIDNPHDVLAEVKSIVALMFRQFDFNQVQNVFNDILHLFSGNYPGYRHCNTLYHDLKHTTDCLLVMARLMHGAMANRVAFTKKEVALGLISALMHDTGYIQTLEDDTGTGAKYTQSHIQRSIKFMEKYFRTNGYASEDFQACVNFLRCTGLEVKIDQINFPSRGQAIIGKMLGTADLIGQMSDKHYLEKIPYLYREYKEGGVQGFEDEIDLLRKTPNFWEFVKRRFATELGQVDGYLRTHFLVRWGINQDLHRQAIDRNIRCLRSLLESRDRDYPKYLGREDLTGILAKMKRANGNLRFLG
jgi:hypothetical protein